MQRRIAVYPLDTIQACDIKRKMLNWSARFSIFLYLDNNDFRSARNGYECLFAAGLAPVSSAVVQHADGADSLDALHQLHNTQRDWLFGHICYDYKNVLERGLGSGHEIKAGFPLLHFFIPGTVVHINREKTILTIESYDDPETVYQDIVSAEDVPAILPKLTFGRTIQRDEYLGTIEKLRAHIADGDCYEINFCSECHCQDVGIEPLPVFRALNTLSPAPYAAYYRLNDLYMMCASPERYLLKQGDKIISQPIKGTARRYENAAEDTAAKDALLASIKERAENVMITDLVRNDLARSCEVGSIKVDELFGIYSFPQVHQMISTVSGTLRRGVPFTDAIRHSFPMGSMTGAPKYKVMQLTEQYERSRRELFSGTVGYITPDGDFDFNVIIRSLFYNASSRYLCYQTGGAITYDSVAEQEWEEARLKAWALERIFS